MSGNSLGIIPTSTVGVESDGVMVCMSQNVIYPQAVECLWKASQVSCKVLTNIVLANILRGISIDVFHRPK